MSKRQSRLVYKLWLVFPATLNAVMNYSHFTDEESEALNEDQGFWFFLKLHLLNP